MFPQWSTDGPVRFDDVAYWEGAEGFTGGDAAGEDVGVAACCVNDVVIGFGERESGDETGAKGELRIPKRYASCLLLVSPNELVNNVCLRVPVHPDVLIPVHGNKLTLILGDCMSGDD